MKHAIINQATHTLLYIKRIFLDSNKEIKYFNTATVLSFLDSRRKVICNVNVNEEIKGALRPLIVFLGFLLL